MWLGFNAILHVASLAATSAPTARKPPAHGSWISRLASLEPAQAEDLELPVIEQPPLTHWPATFEAVLAAMESDGRIYSEGDGSFVLCGTEASSASNDTTCWVGQMPLVSQCLPTSGWRAASEVAPQEVVWRIEGTVVDGCGSVDHITINGAAPPGQWQQLFQLLLMGSKAPADCPPNLSLVAQLHQFGQYVDLEFWLGSERNG